MDCIDCSATRRYHAIHVSVSPPRVMQIYPFPLSCFSPLWYRDTIHLCFPFCSFCRLSRFLESLHYEAPTTNVGSHAFSHVSASNVRYRFVIITNCMDARSKKDRKRERERQESRKRYLFGMLLPALNDMIVFSDWLGEVMLLVYVFLKYIYYIYKILRE